MSENDLHKEWLKLGRKYSKNVQLLNSLWEIFKKNYTQKSRHYHNLKHVSSMLIQVEENKDKIEDIDVVLFAIWFHDIVYKSTKKDNEEKSADLAQSSLQKLSLEKERIDKVYELILSTKTHKIKLKEDNDNAFLLDFDLSILGQEWRIYQKYIENIRREYKVYPSFLYNPGRKKVLLSFLTRDSLYFTEKYRVLYEEQARKNLEKEIKLLA